MSESIMPNHDMDYGTFMATEGGRKCPMCGRYAKTKELGNLSETVHMGEAFVHLTMYGHLPGFGCNKSPLDDP